MAVAKERSQFRGRLLLASGLLVLGLLVAFAIVLSNAQSSSKASIEARVHDRAVLAAALVDSMFATVTLRLDGRYDGRPEEAPRPGIILLDLNMPKKDGREALAEIKSDHALRHIPVVVLTTSHDDHDVVRSYDLGVNSFITKPVTFASLVEVMPAWTRYWFEVVDLPRRDGSHA